MKDKIIIALDFDNLDVAKKLIDDLNDAIFFKVGLLPFLKFGNEIISYLKSKDKKIFLDLKFKDIPNTIYWAVKSSLKYSPDFLTIHLTGGAEMIKKSIEASKTKNNLTILGVTILTSLSRNDLIDIGVELSVEDTVLKLCELGLKNGLKSFVCSPLEIESIRKRFGKDITLVTPGIRPHWSEKGDQKRIFTPKMAIQKGADFLVIGRPITQNKNPLKAFKLILQEIEKS
jgi:orotidine-5'-phosphate decarboxylase